MPLILSIKTADGIVIVGSPAPEDAAFLNHEIFFLGTGHHGLVQRVQTEIERRHTNKAFLDEPDINVIRRKMREAVRREVLPEIEASAALAKLPAELLPHSERTMECLMVFKLNDHLEAVSFDRVGACALADFGKPYLAIGSRAPLAEALLHFFLETNRDAFDESFTSAAAMAYMVFTCITLIPPRTMLFLSPGEEEPVMISKGDSETITAQAQAWRNGVSDVLGSTLG